MESEDSFWEEYWWVPVVVLLMFIFAMSSCRKSEVRSQEYPGQIHVSGIITVTGHICIDSTPLAEWRWYGDSTVKFKRLGK